MSQAMPRQSEGVKTNIFPKIDTYFDDYSAAKTQNHKKQRCKSLVVLTDGLWKGVEEDFSVEDWISSKLRTLTFLHALGSSLPQADEISDVEKIRPITIQFISFGNDPDALARLRYLNDEVKARSGV